VLDPFVFTEILPLNSIINPNTQPEDYLDLYNPFSFFDFLKFINSNISPLEANNSYIEYIKLWGEAKNNTKTQINQTIQERYLELIKEITIKYTTLEEKRFISNIDYTDETELDIILPFYSKKITEICNFYADKREKLKFKIEKNKKKGTTSSVEDSIFETITDVIFSDELEVSNYQKLVNEEILLKDLDIEIEELYDIYTSYLDNNPLSGYDLYDVKTDTRKQLFSSNLNQIDANIFINIDQAITNQLFGNVYVFLNEFGKNFTINYDLNTVDLNCKPDDRLFNLVNENKPKASRLVQLRYDLIKKYIGSDFYYIATGSTITDRSSAVLFKADNPSGNLLNRHFPTTASIEEESDLQSCRRIGLFFTPEKNSILYYSVPEKKYKINESKLEPNKLYIFPDPELYGNTVGLTRSFDYTYPLIHISDYSKSVNNHSLGYIEGDINSNPYTQDFYSYFSRNQLKDSVYMGKEGLKNNFSSLYDKGVVTKWATDIYGNQFSLFKPKNKKNLVDSTILDELTSIYFEDFYGGPITFTDKTLLPEIVLASNPKWVKPDLWSSEYYYNYLIEAGIGNIVNGIMERGIYWDGYSIDGLVIDRVHKLGSEVFDISLNDATQKLLVEIDGDAYNNSPPITFKWDINPNEGLSIPYSYVVDDLFYTRNASNLLPKPNKTLDGNPILSKDTNQFTPHFYYDYVLSSIKYKEFDSGSFIEKNENHQYDFNDKNKFIVNEISEDSKTILYDTNEYIELNSFDIKNSYGSIYVKDIVTGDVSELSSKLSIQFINKYNDIKDELYNNVLDFNIYNNFMWIRTKNHIIFEKLLYQDNNYVFSGTDENFLKFRTDNTFLTNISNPFIFEDRNYSLIVLLSGNNINSNNYSVVPFIYKIDYNTCIISLIYPFDITETIIDSFTNDSSINRTKLRKINKPVLTYNSRNDKYAILCVIEDQNEFVYFYKILFNYDGSIITNIKSTLYSVFENIVSDTKNVFDRPNIVITDFNVKDLTNNTNITVNQEEGTITFG
jgi:hypothetical protein